MRSDSGMTGPQLKINFKKIVKNMMCQCVVKIAIIFS